MFFNRQTRRDIENERNDKGIRSEQRKLIAAIVFLIVLNIAYNTIQGIRHPSADTQTLLSFLQTIKDIIGTALRGIGILK